MGRQLKRVPLDFEWPLNKVWKGYINPHDRVCPDCENGNGATRSGNALERLVHLLLVAGEQAKHGGNIHPWLTGAGIHDAGSILHELTEGLAGREMDRFGHDAIDRWRATKKILEAAGLPEDWGTCKTCGGEGIHPDVKEAHDAWEDYEPPAGDGYQLWENTSEGSPVSPVFETLDALCEWCETNATTFGRSKTTKEEWKRMLSDGFVHHKEGNAIFI